MRNRSKISVLFRRIMRPYWNKEVATRRTIGKVSPVLPSGRPQ